MPPCSCSVFDPVEDPHCWQRYSKRLPVGKTRSSRSRVGVATRQRGQYSRLAFRFLNCSSCSEVRGLPALGGPRGHPGPGGLRGGSGIRWIVGERFPSVNKAADVVYQASRSEERRVG